MRGIGRDVGVVDEIMWRQPCASKKRKMGNDEGTEAHNLACLGCFMDPSVNNSNNNNKRHTVLIHADIHIQ